MNLKLTLRGRKALATMGICGSLLMAAPAIATTKPFLHSSPAKNGEEEPAKKSKAKARKEKEFASLNNQSAKIFPDALKREMHVVAKDNDGKEIDFFVFDLQGNLVKNYKMKAKDHYRIGGLARGLYIYRIFCGDEETASGKFEIR